MKLIDISTPAHPDCAVRVDDDDFEWLARIKWTPKQNARVTYAVAYGQQRAYMHRQIMRARIGEDVDHIDGDGLNNQKGNLRLCTRSQNAFNRRPTRGNSQYKGVHKLKAREVWIAYIRVDNRRISLGRFGDEISAALAYDVAARNYRGDFAYVNFPDAPR